MFTIDSIDALCIIVIILSIVLLVYSLYQILRNPFKYPYFYHTFDVSGKRNVDIDNYIDNFLCNHNNWVILQNHEAKINEWKENCEHKIETCILKKLRSKQYLEVLDDKRAYHFITSRNQTRYRQQNYIKTSYKVAVSDSEWVVNWQWLKNRYEKLDNIDFQATLNEYNTQNQRKLMTKALRKQIMERDNYTCQLCGKHMPDEVGLHIDHILPVSKGGKTVPLNLRVLCSKCNGKKGAKITTTENQ